MKQIIQFSIILLTLSSCHQKVEKASILGLKAEIANWKKELILNGEIGTPCDFENREKWIKKNPEVYYGLPDTIKSKVFDVNNDKISDVLLFFPAGDCCSCSVGINEKSDFVKLIYSDGSDYLTNYNIGEKIENKIGEFYYNQSDIQVARVVFSVTDFKTQIIGRYKLWTINDPDCCASIEGTFKYNPFTFKIEIIPKK